jgi:small subunit ribosomal protein S20
MVAVAVGLAGRLLESPAVANIKSQIKRNRQNEARRLRNKTVRTRLRTEAKEVQQAAATGDQDVAAERLRTTSRLLDKAASRGAIHRRTAARRKSKLARAARSSS